MRKFIPLSSVLVALMIASALSGCGGGKVEPSSAPAPVAAGASAKSAAAKAAAAATAAKVKAAAAAKVKAAAAAKVKAAAAAKVKAAARARAQAAADAAAADAAVDNVYYENCTAVRDAGADPIHSGDPGYSSDLDRDGDGIACE